MYFYCRKCGALVHRSEVDVKNKSHEVIGFLDSSGAQRSIIHTGLTEED